jgi:hypothetical protein
MKKLSSEVYRAAEARVQTPETDHQTSRESGLNLLFNLLRFCLRCFNNEFIVYNGDDPRTSRQPFTNFAQGQFYPVCAGALNN